MKQFWQSKTIMVQIIGGLALILGAFLPEVGSFIQVHFSELGAGWVAVNTILRFITKDQIQIK